jgi:hypothetical protein
MLSTETRQESMVKRIENIVSVIMDERPLFKEDLDYSEMVQHLLNVFKQYLSFEEFTNLSEEELKERCSGIMSVRLLATIGDDFTPEQMAIFDEAIKRK